MAREGRVRLWVSIVGVMGLLAASPNVPGLTSQAVAQTSDQTEDETSEVERIGDWILRLFQSSGEDADESPSKRRNDNGKDGGSGSGSGNGGGGGGSGGGGGGGDDGGGDDGGGDDGGGDDGGEGGDDD